MNKIRIYFILLSLTAVACNKDELITTDVEQVPIITFDTDPAVLLDHMERFTPVVTGKWMGLEKA